ncbi:MAG: DUF2130 domain-containing protein [Chitinophagaceae bacterium]|nr:DUF2130 domain-containing protein [Bacteroidota bacterium]MCC6257444.1 DUF2130 domain-containing protein [Chitinophagaceae bacterium]MCW5917881.1 DUF2130 domain-containing protein [Ferruginibacter sp.]
MANTISCPHCGHAFEVEKVLEKDIEQRLQKEYQERLQQSLGKLDSEKKKLENDMLLFEEKKKKENEIFAQKLQQEKLKLESELQEQIRKTVSGDFENRIKLLQQANEENAEKLKLARQKEFELLQKEQKMKMKEEEMALEMQRKIQQANEEISRQVREQESQKFAIQERKTQLEIKELQIQLEEQRKLAEEMKRRAEQSSMQRQGEAQELLLEEMLREYFPFDVISEVKKGAEGADCIQIIRNEFGIECGSIIYESKRTKGWNQAWVDKLKSDKRNRNADVAILVTQVFPKDMDKFGEREGVWVCSFEEVQGVALLLRQGVINLHGLRASNENKGDKMQMMYDYLTGNEFRGHVEAIAEGFFYMKDAISKERAQMEKNWKEREKQLEKVLLNTSGLFGSVKGIAGSGISDIPLLDGGETRLLD